MPHPAYRIRTATADDLTAVQGLLEVSYAVLWPSHYDAALLAEILPVSARANPALLASGHYFVACIEDGQIIGAGGWSQEPPGRRRKTVEGLGHIRQFCVHPDHVRRGVGRRLFEHCAAQATAAGITRFECISTLNGESFYRALGFIADPDAGPHTGPGRIPLGKGRGIAVIGMVMDLPTGSGRD